MITRRSILAASMTALASASTSVQAEISARIVLTGDMGTTGSALSAYLPGMRPIIAIGSTVRF